MMLALLLRMGLTAKSADGVKVAYDVQGKGSTAVVLIHGWSCNRSYWDGTAAALKGVYKVVRVDLGGHGESSRERKDWTMEAFGEDVAAVVRQEKLKRVVLVGHSMGGPVALEAYRRLGDSVVGLVGVDTLEHFKIVMSEEQSAKFFGPMEKDFQKVTRGMVMNYMFDKSASAELKAKVADAMAAAPPEIGLPAMKNLFAYDATPVLSKIAVPVRLIMADGNPVKEEVRTGVKNLKVESVAHAGHFVMLEKPEEFNRVLMGMIGGMGK